MSDAQGSAGAEQRPLALSGNAQEALVPAKPKGGRPLQNAQLTQLNRETSAIEAAVKRQLGKEGAVAKGAFVAVLHDIDEVEPKMFMLGCALQYNDKSVTRRLTSLINDLREAEQDRKYPRPARLAVLRGGGEQGEQEEEEQGEPAPARPSKAPKQPAPCELLKKDAQIRFAVWDK